MRKKTNIFKRYGLSLAAQRFINNYAETGCATKAAIRTGIPTAKAAKQGKLLLKNSKISACIEELLSLELEKLELNRGSLVKRLTMVTEAKLSDFLTWDEYGRVTLKSPHTISPEKMYCLDTIERSPTGKFKIKLIDRLKAIETLGKIEGSLTKQNLSINSQSTISHSSKLKEPPLEALTLKELEIYRKLVKKMIDYEKLKEIKED